MMQRNLFGLGCGWPCFLLFSIPAFILIVQISAELAYTLLAFSGVYLWLKERPRIWRDPAMQLFSVLMLLFFFSGVVSVALSDMDLERGIRKAGTNLPFLFAPFFAYRVMRHGLPNNLLKHGVQLGAILASIVIGIQWLAGEQRPGGVTNAVIFGDLVVLMAFISIANLPNETGRQRILSLVAFFCGISATLMSLTRGAWVVAPLLAMVTLLSWRFLGMISWKMAMALAASLILVAIAIVSTPFFQERIGRALDEVKAVQDGGEVNTSTGKRLLMWKGGLAAAKERVWFGHGMQNTQNVAGEHIPHKRVKRFITKRLDHLHNEYINTFVGKGITGLLILMAMLFVPVFSLFRHQRTYRNGHEAAWLIGMLLCSGYAVFGLTNAIFGMPLLNIFFIVFLFYALFAPRIATLSQQQA